TFRVGTAFSYLVPLVTRQLAIGLRCTSLLLDRSAAAHRTSDVGVVDLLVLLNPACLHHRAVNFHIWARDVVIGHQRFAERLECFARRREVSRSGQDFGLLRHFQGSIFIESPRTALAIAEALKPMPTVDS